MNFDWSELFLVTTTILFLLFLYVSTINFFYTTITLFFKRSALPSRLIVDICVLFYTLSYAITWQLLDDKKMAKVIFGASILLTVLMILTLINPFILRMLRKRRFKPVERQPTKNSTVDDENPIIDFAIKVVGPKLFLFLLALIFTLPLIGQIGKVIAYQNIDFFVIPGNPECAVVYTRQDSLICKPFNREAREINTSYRIYQNEDLKDINIMREEIGPLRYKPTPTIAHTPMPTQIDTPAPAATP